MSIARSGDKRAVRGEFKRIVTVFSAVGLEPTVPSPRSFQGYLRDRHVNHDRSHCGVLVLERTLR